MSKWYQKNHKLILKYLKTKDIPNRLVRERSNFMQIQNTGVFKERIDLEKNDCTTENMRSREKIP